MPTDISHYPDAAALLWEFLEAKIPLTQEDLGRRAPRLEPHILGDHVDALRLIGMLRKLKGDDEPYVVTPLAMESADLFGDTEWAEGAAFWKTLEPTPVRPLLIAALAGVGAGGVTGVRHLPVGESGWILTGCSHVVPGALTGRASSCRAELVERILKTRTPFRASLLFRDVFKPTCWDAAADGTSWSPSWSDDTVSSTNSTGRS
jgi:hypothetical protein